MKNRPFRFYLWCASVTVLSLVAVLAVWFWNQGLLIDRGMWRTVAWAGTGLFLFLFLYPRKRG